ncbi:MAG TPA: PIN domain-containing protein [Acidobacteriaceae bacterium]|jgi:predicted nucleic acid-binding protein
MPDPVYFETSAVLELLNATAKGDHVRDLIAELQSSKTRIYTSILTVQEASILALSRGGTEQAVYDRINQFARIYSIDRQIALTAARLEVAVVKHLRKGQGVQDEARHRRRWDCIHIATAQVLGCTTLFAYDKHFATRSRQIDLSMLRIEQPRPRQPALDLRQAKLAIVKGKE